MAKQSPDQLTTGTVTEALPSTMFRVDVDGKEILAHLSGKMRIHYIKVMPGDTVQMQMSPDKKRGIIVRRV